MDQLSLLGDFLKNKKEEAHKDVLSNEATMKYLLMGGASSSILVHGFSWLYGSSGGEIELQEIVNGLINTQMYNSLEISIALIFITVGIGFKLSPAPSHQWTPDVYEGVRSASMFLLYEYDLFWAFLIISSLIPILVFFISGFLAPSSKGPEKLSSYESGIEPIGDA
ncbi:hypothetical protein R6Q59_006329 [Mikania micrantha]